MATKLYKFNLRRTYARVILNGKTGNEVVYEFINGNPMTNTPARCLIRGEYEQELLESSPMFKSNTIVLERVTESEDEKAARLKAKEEREQKLASMTQVASVCNVMDAIDYLATNYEVKVKNQREAIAAAEKLGIVFPNLKKGK